MPFLTKSDFRTHLYQEVINNITRDDDSIVDKGISAAIAEAKSYLNRYDLLALFGNSTTEPTVLEADLEHLRDVVKDIACWKMIKLANPNINLELYRTMYEDAIKWLDKVLKGQVDPDGWTYKPDDPNTTEDEGSSVRWSSNAKRTQHF
jgi:phage gp36-like protein